MGDNHIATTIETPMRDKSTIRLMFSHKHLEKAIHSNSKTSSNS